MPVTYKPIVYEVTLSKPGFDEPAHARYTVRTTDELREMIRVETERAGMGDAERAQINPGVLFMRGQRKNVIPTFHIATARLVLYFEAVEKG